MLNLERLIPSLFGYRPDFERNHEIILLDCLQSAARLMASHTLCLRRTATFPQPQDGFISTRSLTPLSPHPHFKPVMDEMLQVFAVRCDGVWLREVSATNIQDVQIRRAFNEEPDASNPGHGVPTTFFPTTGGAILDRGCEPGVQRTLEVLYAYTLPRDTMEWPFHPDHEDILVSGALMLLMERPGKGSDMQLSMMRRRLFSAGVNRVKGEMAMGHVGHDWRQHVQTGGVPLAVASSTPDGPPDDPVDPPEEW